MPLVDCGASCCKPEDEQESEETVLDVTTLIHHTEYIEELEKMEVTIPMVYGENINNDFMPAWVNLSTQSDGNGEIPAWVLTPEETQDQEEKAAQFYKGESIIPWTKEFEDWIFGGV